ncbi:hypothetical protein CI109_100793 [Kwoniella shandongensis]|uniref:Uncharacterized protein n=1 Tax=Kwoniella shandongensis TaxID=1734106 RepID=A0A5M6BUU9_9TREE|nr:uncharacterized protein CI109_005028 [Kwoniella shandongensis]KAA5526638.1 hypothetical protein CI109_005028 [Kwoniella shandongensis]
MAHMLNLLPAGIFQCLGSCLPFCFGRNDDDPERQPLFPPPDHVLTPLRPRRPELPPLSSSSSTIIHHRWASEPVSPVLYQGMKRNNSAQKLSEEVRDKIDTISKAYAGRMHSLNPNLSMPTTPITPHPTLQPLTTDVPPPTTSPHPSPIRPSAPNLGRSASEPRALSDLGFANHQIPSGVSSIVVARGGYGRSRSATTLERFSTIPDSTLEARRGRSPGPSALNLARKNEVKVFDDDYEDGQGTNTSSPGERRDEGDVAAQDVVRRDLGLKGLYRTSPGRGRSRGARSRPARGGRRVMTG